MERARTHHGLTLIEILVVVGIIAILMGILVKTFAAIDTQSGQRRARAAILVLDSALDEYRDANDSDEFPTPAQDADQVDRNRFLCERLLACYQSKVIFDKLDPRMVRTQGPITEIYDPWGTLWDYTSTMSYPLLRSYGPDRLPNTKDDLINR